MVGYPDAKRWQCYGLEDTASSGSLTARFGRRYGRNVPLAGLSGYIGGQCP